VFANPKIPRPDSAFKRRIAAPYSLGLGQPDPESNQPGPMIAVLRLLWTATTEVPGC
jgi:hypothetical protein